MAVMSRMVFLSSVFSFRDTWLSSEQWCTPYQIRHYCWYSVARRWGSAYLWVWEEVDKGGPASCPGQNWVCFYYSHSAGHHSWEFNRLNPKELLSITACVFSVSVFSVPYQGSLWAFKVSLRNISKVQRENVFCIIFSKTFPLDPVGLFLSISWLTV